MKYRVSGTIELAVDMLVDADTPETAIDVAYDTWPGMANYVGNGKRGGAMCGPYQDETDANIDCDGDPVFTEAEIEVEE